MKILRDAADQGQLIVFLGAGASMVPPTALPSWWEVNRALVQALATAIAPIAENAQELADLVTARQEANLLPPEYQAEIITKRLRERYFPVLQCLDSELPNAVHLGLAALAKNGKLKAILTTNFDRVVEKAFEQEGVELDVFSHPDHFSSLANRWEGENNDLPVALIKLHGSIDDPQTLVDTLSQRKRGFSLDLDQSLRKLLRVGHWLFLGYSGADLEADHNYLHLRGDVAEARGFTWLIQKGREALPMVKEIASLYGENAELAWGELPTWLQESLSSSIPGKWPEPVLLAPGELAQKHTANSNKVQQHVQDWSNDIGIIWNGVILSDLLLALGQPQKAQNLLLLLKEKLQSDSPAVEIAAILDALASLYAQQGNTSEALRMYEAALDLFSPEKEPARYAGVLNNLGLVQREIGANQEALAAFERAEAYYTHAENLHGQGIAIHNRALVYEDLGKWKEAQDLYKQELRILDELGDEIAKAVVLNSWGDSLVDHGEFDQAKAQFEEALSIRKRLGDDRGLARTKGNLAKLLFVQGKYSEAFNSYREVLALFEQLGDLRNTNTTLGSMSKILGETGDQQLAMDYLDRALKGAESAGFIDQKVRFLNEKASGLRFMGQLDEAQTTAEQAMGLARELKNPIFEADLLNELGVIAWSKGGPQELIIAEAYLKQSLKLQQKLNRHREMALVYTHLALVSQAHQDYEGALEHYEAALSIQDKYAMILAKANTLRNLGSIHHAQSKLSEAEDYFRQSLALYQHEGLMLPQSQVLRALATTLGQTGKAQESLETFRKARELYFEPSEWVRMAQVITQIAGIYAENDHVDWALAFMEESLILLRKLKKEEQVALNLTTMGNLYLRLDLHKEAAAAYAEAYPWFEQHNPEVAGQIRKAMVQLREILEGEGE